MFWGFLFGRELYETKYSMSLTAMMLLCYYATTAKGLCAIKWTNISCAACQALCVKIVLKRFNKEFTMCAGIAECVSITV